MKDYDFSGWATKNDILCDDGRIIKQDAFKECDGLTVPLVYNHDHKNIGNVLGHCVLENRDDGVYCYGYLDKDTKSGQDALAHIKNGSIKALSIFANKLKEVGHNVVHGVIREVSLVLAGANKGAVIDTVLAHASEANDEEGEAVIITMGNETELSHASTEEKSDDFDLDKEIDSMTEGQKKAMLIMASMMAEDIAKGETVSHASKKEEEEDDEKKKSCSHGTLSLFGDDDDDEMSHASKKNEEDDAEDDDNDDDIDLNDIDFDDDDDEEESTEEENNEETGEEEETKNKNQNNKGEKEMKHNMFENEAQGGVLIHSAEACAEMMADAVKFGSLKDSVMAHSADYGIEDIDMLFPNAKNYTTTPEFIKRRTEWVNEVLTGVRQSPFSRVKTIFADITEDEARAKGYIKGNRKAEEVFTLLKRETTPTTVYKKQRIDRDDIIDITDFSVIEFIKQEMRIMYDEECARAILVGDGRNPLSPDKIKEANIRPIWTDDDLFTIKRAIAVTTATTDQNRAKAFIKNLVKSRKLYRGSGNPTLFIQEDLLADMLLIEDTTGRLIYDSIDKLKNTLRVNKIVEVPIFDGLYRNDNGDTKYLAAIMVNLNDYRTGRDKGGEMSFFDDFDIDFNQQKYLMESRFSGALVVPFSAIAFEFVYNLTLDVQAKDSSAMILGKQVSELQENVFVNDNSVQGILNYVTGYTQFSSKPEEQEGHYLALQFEASEGAVVKIQTIGGLTDEEKTLDSDMDAVIYVKSSKMKLRVTCELNGDVVQRTISFGGLKLLAQ